MNGFAGKDEAFQHIAGPNGAAVGDAIRVKAERKALPIAGDCTAGLGSALPGEVVKRAARPNKEISQCFPWFAGVVAQVLTLPTLFDSGGLYRK